MEWSRVQRALAGEIDVRAAWDEFLASGRGDDVDAFASWLLAEGRVSAERFASLHAGEPITLTDWTDTWADAAPDTVSRAEVPRSLPEGRRYELVGELGKGAMGRVWVARDRELLRKVAFKELLPGNSDRAKQRFLAEVQITAQLDHPGVVPVYDMEPGTEGGPAYAMKLVQGSTLRELIERSRGRVEVGRAPDDETSLQTRLDHFLKICDAVAYAHSKGVVHRDLKPANIMIGRFREVYVMDWGIARVDTEAVEGTTDDPALVADAPGTRLGAVIGTPAYMSPEQARGENEKIGPASDQFALGLILAECIQLHPAYPGRDARAQLALAQAGRPQPLHPAGAGEPVPDALAAIIARATREQPEDRYPSVLALAKDVRHALANDPVSVVPETAGRRLRRWVTRHPGQTLALGVSVLAVLLLGGAWMVADNQLTAARAETRTRAVEHARTRYRSEVAMAGQAIDRHVLFYQGQLEAVAASAQALLEHGTPTDATRWSTQQYRDLATSPPGMVLSAHYHRPISPTEPVAHLPPDTPLDDGLADFSRLAPLRHLLREAHLARPAEPPLTDPTAQRLRIQGDDIAMEWAYFAVERTGLMVMFPGAAGWEDAYDPRTRPWYQEALARPGAHWGSPYADLMGQGRLISCVKAVSDSEGTLLGVAGVDLEFTYLTRTHMRLDREGFVASYLLDETGAIMLATELEDADFVIPATEMRDEGLDYGRFEQPEVLRGAREHTGGMRVGTGPSGRTTWTAWTPLASLGWTFVVVSEPAEAVTTAPGG